MSAATYAFLCRETYHVEKERTRPLPPGWKLESVFAPKGHWGNCYAIFGNRTEKEVVLAIRGTENLLNILTDVELAVSSLLGKPITPRGQEKIEDLAESFTEFGNSPEFTNISNEIRTLEGSFGSVLTSWSVSSLCVAATIFDAYAALGFAGLSQVSRIIAPGATTLNMVSATNFSRRREKDVIQQLRSHPEVSDCFDSIRKNIQKSNTYKNYTFKVIGHSLGGVMAELCAARLGVECVTFESPGSLNLIKKLDKYKESHCNLIQTYLSAPNIINTLNPHPGTIYRMHLPHTDGSFDVAHGGVCVLNSVFRLWSYGSGVGAIISLIGPKLTVDTLSALWQDGRWLRNQHSINNIFQFLVKDGERSRMESWPQIADQLIETRLVALARDLLPFQKDRPGVHNLFDEEGMREAQITRIPGYKTSASKKSGSKRFSPY